jgi:ATP adenylyltransferase/5',5'''-P-1,P-4-tetraphosphate phosphorylase II
MAEQKMITVEELSGYGPVANLNDQANALVKQQQNRWDLARKNYRALTGVQTKKFDFAHFKIIVQHNPERIRSSAAKTDAKSIAQRPCFLCFKNLPAVQKGIPFQSHYLVLVNPFPIFPKHLTIPHLSHTPQRIMDFFPDMLKLSRDLTGFTLFYNGPKCGASAPDHFHFQAGNTGFLPVEEEFGLLEKQFADIIFRNDRTTVAAVENYLRRFVSLRSSDFEEMAKIFSHILGMLPANGEPEPMLNILCNYHRNEWRVIIFPREKQRPSHFFETGKKQIIVGPASVELGGVLILPRDEDFRKITKNLLKEIYEEVTLSKYDFKHWIKNAKDYFKT